MAYSVTRVGGFGRPSAYREFVIDTPADVSTLPVREIAIGSTAFCIEDGMSYVFGNSNTWMECGSNSGGEDSGGSSAGGGIFVINVSSNGSGLAIMDKTFAEIQTAMLSMPVVVNASGRLGVVCDAQEDDRYKTVHVAVSVASGNTVNWSALAFTTGSADGYPSMSFSTGNKPGNDE